MAAEIEQLERQAAEARAKKQKARLSECRRRARAITTEMLKVEVTRG